MYDALARPFAVRSLDDVRLFTAARLSTIADFRGLCRGPVGALEPYVPWREDLLRLRADCYAVNDDARLRNAVRDLGDFLSAEPQPIVVPQAR